MLFQPGSSPRVKLAKDEKTGQVVAIKMVKLTAPQEKLDSVRAEAMILAELTGDHILKQCDYFEKVLYEKTGGKSYEVCAMVLEYAPLGDFFEYISQSGGFREPIARTLMLQVLKAVKTCHDRAIAHRDIKPQNLLLDGEYNLKLADFGFALSNVTSREVIRKESFIGTETFAAPEIYSNASSYDPKAADIFALGVTLFIMRCGVYPFQKASLSDRFYALIAGGDLAQFWRIHTIRRADAKVKSIVSSDFKDLISKMLSPDPAARPTVDEVFKHEWFKGETVPREDVLLTLKQLKSKIDSEKDNQKCLTSTS